MTYTKSYGSKEKKLWSWLMGLIVLLLAIYIVSLNFSVAEAFRRGETEKKSKVLRQDLQKSEEYFMFELSLFYDQYSEQFSNAQISKQGFISRQDNFAIVSGPGFR